MTREFEATLIRFTTAGELVFFTNGHEYSLRASQGSVGDTPMLFSSPVTWQSQVGRRGQLRFTWHATTEAPALYSFESYLDQTMTRLTTLDDVLPVIAGNFIGWKSFAQPCGFLAKASSPVGRV